MLHLTLLPLLLGAGLGLDDPRDLPGNVLWLDGADVDGDFVPGGSFVSGSRWVDKSSLGLGDAVQGTPSARPAVVAGALGGRSVVRFDGTNDFMDVDPAAFGMLNAVEGATLFGVMMSSGATPQSQRALMISTDVSGRTRAGISLFDGFGTSLGGSGDLGSAGRRLDSDPYQRINGGGSLSFGAYVSFHATFDYLGGVMALHSGGTTLFSAPDFQTPGITSATNSANVRLGADADFCACRGWFRGDLAELIVYDRVLSPLERGQVEAYLDAKWFGASSASYCTAGTTASGCTAVLSATGTASASASAGFQLDVTGVEGAKDGILFFGTGGRQASPWGNGTSYQCVVPPVRRTGLQPGSGTSGLCDGSFSLDFNAWMAANPSQAPGAAACVNLQCWFRDPQNTSNQTTSLSDAIEFVVAP